MKAGTIVNLRDEQTLEDIMDDGSVLTSLPLTITRIRKFVHSESGISWELIEFDEDDNLFLLRKSVDKSVEWKVFFIPDGIPVGSRNDLLNDGMDFIFEEDEEADVDDLEYALSIHDDTQGFEFRNVCGTFIGNSIVENDKVVDNSMFLITEWLTDDDKCDNPELFCLEHSSIDEGAEGFVLFLQGCVVNEHDVEVSP